MSLSHKYLFPLSLAIIGFILSVLYSLDTELSLKAPLAHDEYAYILGADTFLKGRLSNPTPAHWEHFEAYHILMSPTYMSKYPPGQSLQLAVGKILGHYLIGVWLTVALIGVLLFWLLRSYTSPWLAWLVTLAYLVQINEFEWGSNYWGGSCLTLAGILVFGGSLWMLRYPRLSSAIIIGIGMVLMINTRPFEALIFCGLCGISTSAILWGKKQISSKVQMYGATVVLFGLIGVAITGAYNYRTMGDPFTFPHQRYTETYHPGLSPFTLFESKASDESLPMPTDMRNFLRNEINKGLSMSTKVFNYIKHPGLPVIEHFFLISPVFIILPLLILRPKYPSKIIIHCGFVILGYFIVYFLSVYELKHYYALWLPPCALLSALSIQSILKARLPRVTLPRQRQLGLILIFGTIFIQNGFSVWEHAFSTKARHTDQDFNTHSRLEKELRQTGKHYLCLVKYTESHNPELSWISNQPNIEEAPVIWARSISQIADQQLAQTYENREIRYLFVSSHKYTLLPEEAFYSPRLKEVNQ